MKRILAALIALILLCACALAETMPLIETTTLNDEPFVLTDDCAGAKLIMLNLWEPWCNPCVSEMPGLEALYEKYAGDGFVILGAFGSAGMDDETRAVVEALGITYPVLRVNETIRSYTTGSVPTTWFLNGDGTLISTEPIVGALPESSWEEIITMLLNA